MRSRAALALLLAFAASVSRAAVNVGSLDLTCRLHHRPQAELNALSKTPQFLRDYVASAIGPMAERGEPFDSTDVFTGRPGARFIRAGRVGNEWYLWYEQGGITYTKHILVLRLGAEFSLVADKVYVDEDPCALTDGLLDSTP